jgi:lipopolysaccharide/colanic/teichoic acid biosynthesis glycosyltransferase
MYTSSHIHWLTAIGKRLFDLVGATLGLLFTMPFIPFIVIAIRLNSPGPIFFKQLRIGTMHVDRTDLFMMLKFRTMGVDAEANSGAVWAKENDPRITRVGNFLRKTRLDEIPQLLNVLKGDMSLIGPRPERPGFYDRLENAIPFFAERTYGVTPGITGLAQVNQGYDTSLDDVRSKLAYDLAYSLVLNSPGKWLAADINIALKTVGVMFGKRGR